MSKFFDQIAGDIKIVNPPTLFEQAKRQIRSAQRRMLNLTLREDVRHLAALDLKHWRRVLIQQKTNS